MTPTSLPVLERNSTSITCPLPLIPKAMHSTIVEVGITASAELTAAPVARAYIELLEPSVISSIDPEVSTPGENMTFELQGTFTFASEKTRCRFSCIQDGGRVVVTGPILVSIATVVECEIPGVSSPLGLCQVSLLQDGIQVSSNSLRSQYAILYR